MEVVEQSAGVATGRSMRRVALIENPASGSVSPLRRGVVRKAMSALAGADIEAAAGSLSQREYLRRATGRRRSRVVGFAPLPIWSMGASS